MSSPRRLRCTVEGVKDHGGRVYTVDLRPDGLLPVFRPGQFLHLTVDPCEASGFWPESRVFSVASSPFERHRIRICYAVKGRYTARMEEALAVGATAWIKLPYGNFIIDDAAEAVLIAGGTGITAFTAFLESLNPVGCQKVWLVYGARSSELILFMDVILAQLDRVPRFNAMFFVERGGDCNDVRDMLRHRAACDIGRISMKGVWALLEQAAGPVFYLSGPPVMLRDLASDIRDRGVPADRVRMDAWE